ncbi:hypothetical protein ACQ3I4_01100 [Zafaria sp. Z1313]|uniref:hypothetical protein n=1 Tax=unclassified Zafaria TaxID=2828765 RepID=UPI002E75C8EE|nr:hypothetical protein [Zafaria sp. J156]MEE1619978.1 hypothetical protein [Zafaria sp. J156]
MYSDGKNKAYSGQGNFVGNFIAFLAMFLVFIGALFVLSFWTLETAWWPGLVCLGLAGLAFAVPQHVLGRSDSHHRAAEAQKAVEHH